MSNSEEKIIEDAIRRNAAGPESAEVDGQKVEQHSASAQKFCRRFSCYEKVTPVQGSSMKVVF